MPVTVLARWKGDAKDAANAGKKARPILEKHGAEMVRMSTFYSGPYTGQVLVAIRYPDWKTYGKAQDKLAQDAQYQKLMGEVRKTSELQSRNLLVSLDI